MARVIKQQQQQQQQRPPLETLGIPCPFLGPSGPAYGMIMRVQYEAKHGHGVEIKTHLLYICDHICLL